MFPKRPKLGIQAIDDLQHACVVYKGNIDALSKEMHLKGFASVQFPENLSSYVSMVKISRNSLSN